MKMVISRVRNRIDINTNYDNLPTIMTLPPNSLAVQLTKALLIVGGGAAALTSLIMLFHAPHKPYFTLIANERSSTIQMVDTKDDSYHASNRGTAAK